MPVGKEPEPMWASQVKLASAEVAGGTGEAGCTSQRGTEECSGGGCSRRARGCSSSAREIASLREELRGKVSEIGRLEEGALLR